MKSVRVILTISMLGTFDNFFRLSLLSEQEITKKKVIHKMNTFYFIVTNRSNNLSHRVSSALVLFKYLKMSVFKVVYCLFSSSNTFCNILSSIWLTLYKPSSLKSSRAINIFKLFRN